MNASSKLYRLLVKRDRNYKYIVLLNQLVKLLSINMIKASEAIYTTHMIHARPYMLDVEIMLATETEEDEHLKMSLNGTRNASGEITYV